MSLILSHFNYIRAVHAQSQDSVCKIVKALMITIFIFQFCC